MRLPEGEPTFGPWADRSFGEVARLLGMTPGSRGVVAVDGRSASGKTSFADGLARAVDGSVVVHTDDVAWHHSFFDWSDLLVEGVLEPFRAGGGVSYRPPAWEERQREGSIDVPADAPWLIIEGVGAARTELSSHLDAVVWVQSDFDIARDRGIERDGGDQAAEDFWDEWMAAELSFLAEHRPWDRADLIVNGTLPEPTIRGSWISTER